MLTTDQQEHFTQLWTQAQNKPVSFDIWRRDMPGGGEVVLGPAARPGSIGASTILYGIAALPIEAAPRPNR